MPTPKGSTKKKFETGSGRDRHGKQSASNDCSTDAQSCAKRGKPAVHSHLAHSIGVLHRFDVVDDSMLSYSRVDEILFTGHSLGNFTLAIIRNCPSGGKSNRIPAEHLADIGRRGTCKGMLPAMAEPLEVNSGEFDEFVRDSKVPVLVDFWAAWYGPCRTAAPHVAQVARDLAGRAVVLEVDTERYPELASRYNVQGIPNFVVFTRGSLPFQQVGLVDANTMKSWLVRAA
jgi:thioredoxin 2